MEYSRQHARAPAISIRSARSLRVEITESQNIEIKVEIVTRPHYILHLLWLAKFQTSERTRLQLPASHIHLSTRKNALSSCVLVTFSPARHTRECESNRTAQWVCEGCSGTKAPRDPNETAARAQYRHGHRLARGSDRSIFFLGGRSYPCQLRFSFFYSEPPVQCFVRASERDKRLTASYTSKSRERRCGVLYYAFGCSTFHPHEMRKNTRFRIKVTLRCCSLQSTPDTNGINPCPPNHYIYFFFIKKYFFLFSEN